MAIKVKPIVKKWTPLKFALHEILRPGPMQPFSSLITWTMIECQVDYSKAEAAVYGALEYAEINNLSYQDRDSLHLPNISCNYPTYPEIRKYWNSPVMEKD